MPDAGTDETEPLFRISGTVRRGGFSPFVAQELPILLFSNLPIKIFDHEIVEQLRNIYTQNKYLNSRPQTTDYVEAENKWLDMIRRDAEKEFAMGDIEEQQLTDFLAKVK